MIMRDVTRGGEGSRLFGRRSTDLSGALRIFKTKLGDNVLKVKVSLVDVVNSFVYICVSS